MQFYLSFLLVFAALALATPLTLEEKLEAASVISPEQNVYSMKGNNLRDLGDDAGGIP
ncbi:hypothetical protein BC834DRAFT_974135 [Gloeopeniophorella convolvens]|nr:hypothetical protein BC834DRAFT_974135 [Gloeopeniophorella convolvens]